MRTYVNAALVAAILASLSYSVQAGSLLPAGASDQVPTRLTSLPAPAGQFERAPVSFSWALDPYAALSTPSPHVAESREYWQTVDASELRRGMELRTTSPGALIRVSPARGANALGAGDFAVASAGKAARIERIAGAEELRAAGMDVDTGTAVLKLARENAAGRYTLRAAKAQGRYVVHVFEPESEVVLQARADRGHVLGGDTIAVSVDMTDHGRPLQAQAEALLVAPDGSSHPVAVTQTAEGLVGRAQLPVQASASPGLWELQVFANGNGISRDARTAFAVAAPTARFTGEVEIDGQTLRATLPVEVASPGRYEARAVLFATAPDGVLRPVSQAHTAAWSNGGTSRLALAFDANHVPDGFGAPYEVRQLQLLDQTRMAPLESRERGARF